MRVRRLALISLLGVGLCAAAQKPQLAITFDDLPAHGPLPAGEARPEVVRSILATLKRENMPPVYGFVNGFRLANYPYQVQILEAWHAAGEPMGNHTYDHPEFDATSVAAYERDIARDEPTLQRVDPGGDWHWFRFPFLEEGKTVEKREELREWLTVHHYRVAEVSMDFQDYDWNDAYARCDHKHDATAIRKLHDSYLGAAAQASAAFRELAHRLYGHDVPYILLMHVGAFDARMLPELIAQFRAEGYEFVTLEQAEADPIYDVDPKQPTPSGATFMETVAWSRNVHVPDLPDNEAALDKTCR